MIRLYKKNKIHAVSKTSLVNEKHGPFYFDQPVDHSDTSAGTFKHRYWANTDWYQAGGPVICKLIFFCFCKLTTILLL